MDAAAKDLLREALADLGNLEISDPLDPSDQGASSESSELEEVVVIEQSDYEGYLDPFEGVGGRLRAVTAGAMKTVKSFFYSQPDLVARARKEVAHVVQSVARILQEKSQDELIKALSQEDVKALLVVEIPKDRWVDDFRFFGTLDAGMYSERLFALPSLEDVQEVLIDQMRLRISVPCIPPPEQGLLVEKFKAQMEALQAFYASHR